MVFRELTKIHEQCLSGSLSQLLPEFDGKVRGELVIIIRGSEQKHEDKPDNLDDLLRWHRDEMHSSLKDAVREIAGDLDLSRSLVYEKALVIWKEKNNHYSMNTFEPFNKIGFAVDRGGTFTDVFAVQHGVTYTEKLLSEDPANYKDAPREGIRRLLERITGRKIRAEHVSTDSVKWIRMGTTVATNALLERQGAPCCLVITRGFADLLRIGYQNRPELFALNIIKPQALYVQVLEIDERVCPVKINEKLSTADFATASGTSGDFFKIIKKPDESLVREQLQAIYDQGIRSLAVVLMHGYNFHDHELLIGTLAESIGFTHISLSHRIMPRIRITGRGDTTCLDAYLTPHVTDYLNNFRRGFKDNLENKPLHFMRSDGGLVKANNFQGSNAILSGPAGGL